MQGTIVGLAQDFVGANNLPLFVACGQFGSRAMGGKDHASARYIHTKLHPIARAIFPKADDYLLNYKDDDGTPVEPEWFIPILPMCLINGTSGIGTGFATNIPSYSPKDLMANVRRLIKGEQQQPLVPWIRGHKGAMKDNGGGKFTSFGVVKQVDSRVVRISELPIGLWTDAFQKNLDEMQEKGYISGYRNHTTSEEIDIDIGFNANVLSRITERPQGLY